MRVLAHFLLVVATTWVAHGRSHFYDAGDRLRLTVDPSGAAVRYTYDDADNLTKMEALTVPAAPSDLTVTRTDLTRASLNWMDNADGEAGFRLMRRLSGDNLWQTVIVLNPNETSYTDVSLDPKENYVYRLLALTDDDDLTSAYSNSATAAGLGSEVFEMSEPVVGAARMEFSFQSEAGEAYIVEASATLDEASWSPVPFATMPNDVVALQGLTGNGARITVYLDLPEGERLFYRVTKQ